MLHVTSKWPCMLIAAGYVPATELSVMFATFNSSFGLTAGPWFMMAHPEFGMPDGKRRFGAYEYPSGKGSKRKVAHAAKVVFRNVQSLT